MRHRASSEKNRNYTLFWKVLLPTMKNNCKSTPHSVRTGEEVQTFESVKAHCTSFLGIMWKIR